MSESDKLKFARTITENHVDFPNGLDDCTLLGMSGFCNNDCEVYLRGNCPEPQEIEDIKEG